MLLCTWKFTEVSRTRLCLILAIFNWFAILLALVLLAIGVYIKMTVSKFTHMVENYHGDALPVLFMLMGLLSAVTNAGGGYLIFSAQHPSHRERHMGLMLGYIIASGIILLCILAGGVMCYTDIENLHDAFRNGLQKALEKYRDHALVKERFDKLQIKFQCCGNNEFRDWFSVSWISENYIDTKSPEVKSKMEDGSYKTDDVPFSCCDPSVPRPCITHNIRSKEHVGYDYALSLTIYKVGCREALMSFFGEKLLFRTGILVASICFVQCLISFFGRYLQTCMATAVAMGDPTTDSVGYLFLCGAPPNPNRRPSDDRSCKSRKGDEYSQPPPTLYSASIQQSQPPVQYSLVEGTMVGGDAPSHYTLPATTISAPIPPPLPPPTGQPSQIMME